VTDLYPYGYAGAKLTLEQIAAKSQIAMMDPEFQRRVFAMMRVAKKAGVSLGIGGAGRTTASQTALFLRRHEQVLVGGCCRYQGKRYKLKPHNAHAAPPGLSYHEPTTPAGKVLAADMIGNLKWMAGACGEFGLREFSKVNSEPWHIQPAEIPGGRSSYSAARHHPLKQIVLPDQPLPTPLLKRGDSGPEVARLQDMLRAHGFDPGLSDGKFGPRTEASVRDFQLSVGLPVTKTATATTWAALS